MPQFLHITPRGGAEGLGSGLAPPPSGFPELAGEVAPGCWEEGLSAQAPGVWTLGFESSLQHLAP